MDYKEQIEQAKHTAIKWRTNHPIVGVGELRVDLMVDDLCSSIADLLSRAESAEARCETLEKMVKEYQEVIIPGYREQAEKAEECASDLCDDFTDYVVGGVPNAAPYCANSRPECVDGRGWCNGDNRICKGFLPKAAVVKEE